jgi:hemerythrin superfamily protein
MSAIMPNPNASVHETGIVSLLSRDHARIDELLQDLVAIVDDRELERAQYVFPDVRAALTHHIRAEEEVLFPALEVSPTLRPPCAVMRSEHRRIESELSAIDEALEHGRLGDASFALGRLAGMLADHDYKEEHVLYPRAEMVLDGATADRLRHRFS